MIKYTAFFIFLCLATAEVPLYIPADLPCSDLWSHHLELGTSGGGESPVWDEAGDMCNITYRAVAVSTPEGRTTVSYDTTFQVHKELLSQILNTVLRVRERDSRQVGDPFITPYLAGVYQRLGLEYSSLLCFTRITLLWRRISAARATAAVTAPTTALDDDDDAAAGRESTTWASTLPRPEPSGRNSEANESAPSAEAKEAGPGALSRIPARVVSLEWHVQQLHRELVLEPWKAADLRLMLSRAAAYAEVYESTKPCVGAIPASCSRAGVDACGAARNGAGTETGGSRSGEGFAAGSWLPRHASALVGGGTRLGGYSSSTGGSSASSGLSSASGRDAACAGLQAGPFDAAVFWLLWLVCPTLVVALEAMQAAPDNPWMALYICIIATCRTLAEWRAAISVACAPNLTWPQRLYGLAVAHLASGGASAVLTGLLNTWLPLLGHGAAAAVVWLHLLLLPAVMVAVMYVVGMPQMTCQLAAAGGGMNGGRIGGAESRRSGARERRHTGGGVHTGGAGDLGVLLHWDSQGNGPLGRRGTNAAADDDRGVHGGGSGRTGTSLATAAAAAAAAAAAQVHWPPALEIPAWLEDWPNAPEAFRCPITQSLMREPAQASSGVTYERPAIMQWLEHRRVDPVTHVPLKRHRLAPNLNLRHMIEVWVQDRVEARRRLAQRLRAEVSAEAATLAAMEAAEEAKAAATASSSESDAVETSASEAALAPAPAPAPAETSQSDVPNVAAGDATAMASGVAANEAADEAVASATTALAALTTAAGRVPAARGNMEEEGPPHDQGAESGPTASQHAHQSQQPYHLAVTPLIAHAGTGPPNLPGNAGSALGPGEATDAPSPTGAGSSAAVEVEEVEALAIAAARARNGCRHCYAKVMSTAGCSAAGAPGGCFMATAARRSYGGGGGGGGVHAGLRRRPLSFRQRSSSLHAGGRMLEGDDAGASSSGSRESPFTTPLARDASGAGAAETELPGTDAPDTDRSGIDNGSSMYGSSLARERSDREPNAEHYYGRSSANGLRHRLRGQLGSGGGATAADAVSGGAAVGMEDDGGGGGGFSSRRHRRFSYQPNWDGVYPESSGALAVDGSGTNTLQTPAGASGSRVASSGVTVELAIASIGDPPSAQQPS